MDEVFFSFLSIFYLWQNIRLVTFRLENIFDFALLFTYRYFIYDQQLSKLRSEFWIWQRVDFVNESKFLKSDEKSAKSAKSTKPFEACKTVKTSKSRLSEFTVYNRFIWIQVSNFDNFKLLEKNPAFFISVLWCPGIFCPFSVLLSTLTSDIFFKNMFLPSVSTQNC